MRDELRKKILLAALAEGKNVVFEQVLKTCVHAPASSFDTLSERVASRWVQSEPEQA